MTDGRAVDLAPQGTGRPGRILAVLAAVAAAALLSAGCGGGTATLTGTARTHAAPAAKRGSLQVTEKEYSITVSQATIRPGAYTVEVVNRGRMTHNLNIKGPGVGNWRSPNVSPGATANVGVTLRAGQYELWCSIDHHRALGMDTKIQVV